MTLNLLSRIKLSQDLLYKLFICRGSFPILFCKKEFTSESYHVFQMELIKVKTSSISDQKVVENLFSAEIKEGSKLLFIMGLKQVEKIEVTEYIANLKQAKKKIWVLTGDSSLRTLAICNTVKLLDKDFIRIDFTADDYDTLSYKMRNYLNAIKNLFQGKTMTSSELTTSTPSPQKLRKKFETTIHNGQSLTNIGRKSIIYNFNPDDKIKLEMIVNGKSFSII